MANNRGATDGGIVEGEVRNNCGAKDCEGGGVRSNLLVKVYLIRTKEIALKTKGGGEGGRYYIEALSHYVAHVVQ